MRIFFFWLAPLLILGATLGNVPQPAPVRPGTDVLLSEGLPRVLEGKRVGLITNHTGIDRNGTSSIDRLHGAKGLRLVALYAPEHGIRGTVADGDLHLVRPRPAHRPLDPLGLRGDPEAHRRDARGDSTRCCSTSRTSVPASTTYIWTMFYAMEAAAERKIWVNPSPNIRRFETTLHYPGTVLLEGTNLTEGRGTDLPFEHTGAPWLDAKAVAAEMNAMRLPAAVAG